MASEQTQDQAQRDLDLERASIVSLDSRMAVDDEGDTSAHEHMLQTDLDHAAHQNRTAQFVEGRGRAHTLVGPPIFSAPAHHDAEDGTYNPGIESPATRQERIHCQLGFLTGVIDPLGRFPPGDRFPQFRVVAPRGDGSAHLLTAAAGGDFSGVGAGAGTGIGVHWLDARVVQKGATWPVAPYESALYVHDVPPLRLAPQVRTRRTL